MLHNTLIFEMKHFLTRDTLVYPTPSSWSNES